MIQSDKFDSSKMDIKKLANSVFIFIVKRLIEIIGIILFLGASHITFGRVNYLFAYDPNFIFPENTEIKNLLGFMGVTYLISFFNLLD